MLDGGTYWPRVALQLGSAAEEQPNFPINPDGTGPGCGGADEAEEA